MSKSAPWLIALGCLLPGVVLSTACAQELPMDFRRDVRPILSDHCFKCHGPDANQRQADLRLDDREGLFTVISPGVPDESEFVARILSTDPELTMPPPETKRELTAEQKATLVEWIRSGATWESHWSFESIERPHVPVSAVAFGRQQNPVDAFVQSRLVDSNLAPAAEASRARLIRRLSLDLTGLPPTPAAVERFVNDSRPDAYEQLVDHLLASPRFGERMAWDWLDAARYADSNGYQGDGERTMWPWRDWVVSAINDDLSFDKFTRYQLAGDLLPLATDEQRLATGFCRNHMINGEGGRIPEENRVDYVMDMTETMGTVWLGLTLNCCRCHDHKFDPLTQRDYYQLFAFFNQTPVDGSGGSGQTAPVMPVPTRQQRVQEQALQDDLAALQIKLADNPAYQDVKTQIDQRTASLESIRNAMAKVMIMEDMPDRRETFVLNRGLYNDVTDQQVDAAVPTFLRPSQTDAPASRADLAEWIVANDNPLTARVIVNRYWQQFFGVGLVKTVEDFGVQGETPEHQLLLDWLADDFRSHGWSVKRLVRTLVTSHTYRQSSKMTSEHLEIDPENRLLSRGARFRLPSWMIRDQVLAASGLLVGQLGGAPVNGYQPPGVWEEATFGNKKYRRDDGEALYRRSLYTFWRRIIGPTVFFDSASRQTCTVKVVRTNTPLHALLTLNDVTYVEAARALAQRQLLDADLTNDESRLDDLYVRLLARRPNSAERQIWLAALARARKQYADDRESAFALLSSGESSRDETIDVVEHAAWTALTLTVFNLDETLNRQ